MNALRGKEGWLAVAAGGLILCYCVFTLAYVVTSPDLRLRFLLADETIRAEAPYGIIIRQTPAQMKATRDARAAESSSASSTWFETEGSRRRDSAEPTDSAAHSIEWYKGPLQPRIGDILLQIGDQPINSLLDVNRAMSVLRRADIAPGAVLDPGGDPSESFVSESTTLSRVGNDNRYVKVLFSTPDDPGSPQAAWLLVQSLPLDSIVLPLVWFLLQLGIFGVSVLAVWHRPFDRAARLFFAMCVVTLGAFVGGYHWWVIAENLWLNAPFVLCAMLVPSVTLHFFLVYPRPVPVIGNWPRLTLSALYLIPVASIVVMFGDVIFNAWLRSGEPSTADLLLLRESLTWLRTGIYWYLAIAAGHFGLMLLVLAYSYSQTRSPIERSQMQWMFLAALFATVPLGYTLYLAIFDRIAFALGEARLPMFLTSLLFMLAYAVGMVRYKLMLLEQIISRGVLYYVFSSGITLAYGAVIAVSSLLATLLGREFPPQQSLQQAIAVAGILVLVILMLLWLRDQFQEMIDRRFFREKYQLDKALQRMNRALGHLVDGQSLADRMLTTCQDVLGVQVSALYLRSGDRLNYQLISGMGVDRIPLTLTLDEECLATLHDEQTVQRIVPGSRSSISATQKLLRELSAEVIHALELDEEVAGLVVLGPKGNGAAYTAEDLTFLNAVGQITSVALHGVRLRQEFTRLNEDMRLKVNKIAEQQRQITMMQAELSDTQDHEVVALPAVDEFRRESIRGSSPAIQRVLATVRKVSNSESSVLIRGESGTGKELLAQALHDNSARANNPIIRVHCAALSPSLLESELFGHTKGAFTGAHKDRAGRFEMAHGGTLFLDEIGDISLETQVKLLRVLQERSFEPVGGTRTIQVDVRLIAATHQDLEKLIAAGSFREDLYYRLNVISIHLPSLAERREDIFELSLHFLKHSAQKAGKRITHIDAAAMDVLHAYHWPGNVRELENVIERAVVLADEECVRLQDLPVELLQAKRTPPVRVLETKPMRLVAPRETEFAPHLPTAAQGKIQSTSPGDTDDAAERSVLTQALEQCDGNKAQAARLLGMPRSTYYSKLKKYGIQ